MSQANEKKQYSSQYQVMRSGIQYLIIVLYLMIILSYSLK